MSSLNMLDKLIAPMDEKHVTWYDIARILTATGFLFANAGAQHLFWLYRLPIVWVTLTIAVWSWTVLVVEAMPGPSRRAWAARRLKSLALWVLPCVAFVVAADHYLAGIQIWIKVGALAAGAAFVAIAVSRRCTSEAQ